MSSKAVLRDRHTIVCISNNHNDYHKYVASKISCLYTPSVSHLHRRVMYNFRFSVKIIMRLRSTARRS